MEDRFTSHEFEWSGNLFDFYERAYGKMRQLLDVPFKPDGIYRVGETPAHEAPLASAFVELTLVKWNRGFHHMRRDGLLRG